MTDYNCLSYWYPLLIEANIPVAQKVRLFVRDGNVECIHPYMGGVTSADRELLTELGELVANAIPSHDLATGDEVPAYWSVDCVQTTNRQWYVTDIALGKDSYHWEGCDKA